MRSRALYLLAFTLLLFAGCDAAVEPSLLSDANPAKVIGKKWKWEAYTTITGGYRTDVPEGSYFVVRGNTISGVSGCNSFWGDCSIDPAALVLAEVMTTLVGCEGKSFVCELGQSPIQYRQRDSVLILVPEAGDMVHLIFRQQ